MEKRFWIVDTSNLSTVTTTFIGYTVTEDGQFFYNKKPSTLDGTGSYTCVESLPDKIIISQDFEGMQGIYHFKKEERNIFSNGYYKLVEYIQNLKYPLTLDKGYCIQYIFSNEEAINMNDTLLNEVKRIGKDFRIEIYKNDGNVVFTEINYKINTIKIDSEETIPILDKWYYKWCKVFRSLVKMNSPLIVDLSGGFDSRACFGMIMNSNIDKNNISVKRNKAKKTSYKKNYDDWEISGLILKEYNMEDRTNVKFFKNKIIKNPKNIELFDEFDNLIFGNSKICDYTDHVFSEPIFHICGIYGDRNHLGDIQEVNNYLNHKKIKFANDMREEDKKIFVQYIDKYADIIFKKYEANNAPIFIGDFSFEYICRFFGAKITQKIFNNNILVCPFADPSIHKIQTHLGDSSKNYHTLICLIYTRYFDVMLKFPFQTDSTPRVITEEEIQFAKKQCELYPFKKIEYEIIPNLIDDKKIIYKYGYEENDVREVLKQRLLAAESKFTAEFCKEYFELAMRDLKNDNIRLQNYLTPIVSICSILNKLNN